MVRGVSRPETGKTDAVEAIGHPGPVAHATHGRDGGPSTVGSADTGGPTTRTRRVGRLRWLRASSASLPLLGVALYEDPSMIGAAIGLAGMMVLAGWLNLALRAYDALDGAARR